MKTFIQSQTIRAAKAKEQLGDTKRALRLYQRFPDNPVAQERVQALAPLQFSNPDVFRHSKILTRDEMIVLEEIIKIQKEKRTLKQKLLVDRTGLPAAKITALMERLQDKGYISKLPFRYQQTTVLEAPPKAPKPVAEEPKESPFSVQAIRRSFLNKK